MLVKKEKQNNFSIRQNTHSGKEKGKNSPPLQFRLGEPPKLLADLWGIWTGIFFSFFGSSTYNLFSKFSGI